MEKKKGNEEVTTGCHISFGLRTPVSADGCFILNFMYYPFCIVREIVDRSPVSILPLPPTLITPKL